jgi:predicted ATPase with chaperone activity
MNPCPCGWYGDPVRECTCSHAMVSRYQSDPRRVGRISGPLLDRADLQVDNIRCPYGDSNVKITNAPSTMRVIVTTRSRACATVLPNGECT